MTAKHLDGTMDVIYGCIATKVNEIVNKKDKLI